MEAGIVAHECFGHLHVVQFGCAGGRGGGTAGNPAVAAAAAAVAAVPTVRFSKWLPVTVMLLVHGESSAQTVHLAQALFLGGRV